MKVGDFVKDNHPTRSNINKVGVILERTRLGTTRLNRCFKILWCNGTIGNNVWDYDLKVIHEGR